MIFTKEHEMVRQLARKFAEQELAPIADEVDKTGEFPQSVLDKMAKSGFYGIKTPVEYGGAGGDHRSYVICMEEMARKCAVATIYMSSPNSLVGAPFLLVGTEEQKEKYLRPLVEGKSFLAFALTEPGAGSDVSSLQTTAVEDGDDYILNGRKTFITGAPIADAYIVFAKTDASKGPKGITSFVVDRDTPGLSLGKPEDKMGMIGCPTSDVILENVRVPKSAMLGRLNQGFVTAMKTLSVGRLGIAAQAVGLAQGAMDEAITYAKQRQQFGRPIANFQGLQWMLADMETRLNAARLLTYNAALLMDQGKQADKEASMAKLYAAECAERIASDALQIHGGYGYIKDYPIERIYRDVRVTSLYEGTSQVQKIVIAGSLLK